MKGLDDSLRPGTMETLQRIKDDGHEIYIWSGMGERWEVVKKHNLEPLINGVYEKPTHHFHERLEELSVPFEPDFFIDAPSPIHSSEPTRRYAISYAVFRLK